MYVYNDCLSDTLLQFRATGGLGCHGAHAVSLVVKVCSPESACATTLLQHLMGRSVRAQTPRLNFARRNPVLVRAQKSDFTIKSD